MSSRVCCLLGYPFGSVTFGVNWVVLWCLKPTTGCVGFGDSFEGLWNRSMSDAACNWSWATCLELPCDLQFVASSAGPGCGWEGPSCVPASSLGAGRQKAHSITRSTSTCQLPVRCWKSLWQYGQLLGLGFSESPGRGACCSLGWYRFKLCARVGSEAPQQKSQGTPRPATTHLATVDLCDGRGSRRVVRMWPAKFTRLKQSKVWPCRGRAPHCNRHCSGAWE